MNNPSLAIRLLTLGLLAASTLPVWSQSVIFGPTPVPEPTRGPWSPAPYRADEFPQELKDIRRAEVITLGAVPITYLFASTFYDIGRYAYTWATSGETAASAVVPFSTSSTRFSSEEVVGLLVSSVIVGGVIALLDNLILTDRRNTGKAEAARLEKLRLAEEALMARASLSPESSPSPAPETLPSPSPAPETPVPLPEASAHVP